MSVRSIFENVPSFFLLAVGLIASTIAVTNANVQAENVITEVSGITRLGGKLLMVSDDANGCYFELKIDDLSASVIPIDPVKIKRVKMNGCEAVGDFESIAVLADGRVAILSEDMHALYAPTRPGASSWGVLVKYDQSVSEFGNRGLEGVSSLASSDGTSKVAVVWEGGYPVVSSLPEQIQNTVGHSPLVPILVLTDVPRNAMGLEVDDTASYISLRLPKLKESGSATNEPILLDSELPKATEPNDEPAPPFAQRFRAPDLVWHQWKTDSGVDTGLIVLLTSENSPLRGSGASHEFKYKELQRFDQRGKPVGTAIEINDLVKPIFDNVTAVQMRTWSERMKLEFAEVRKLLEEQNWENVNWEGLDWFVRGQSLILIYDGVPTDPPFAVVIPIPDNWK